MVRSGWRPAAGVLGGALLLTALLAQDARGVIPGLVLLYAGITGFSLVDRPNRPPAPTRYPRSDEWDFEAPRDGA